MNATLSRALLVVASLSALSSMAVAQAPSFGAPDAPLPAGDGTGLSGFLWNSPAIEPVDDLTAARAYIGANAADATFVSTVVDYPNGISGSTTTDALISAALGVDAASLSVPAVGAVPVLNSILQFKGFLRVDVTGTHTLGLGSDDGSELLIQGTQVVNNDGLHGFPGAAPVDVEFTTSGLYAIEILFFESQTSEWGLEFYFETPAAGTPVPTELLYEIPEPSTAALAGAGLIAMRLGGRRGRLLAAAPPR